MGIFRRNRTSAPAAPPAPPQRRGLYKSVFTGAGLLNKGFVYNVTCEVTEIDRIGDESKLRVDEVYGVDAAMRKNVAEQIEGWQKTALVTWREPESSEEWYQRFIRAGGCGICGSAPGMPCDTAMHS